MKFLLDLSKIGYNCPLAAVNRRRCISIEPLQIEAGDLAATVRLSCRAPPPDDIEIGCGTCGRVGAVGCFLLAIPHSLACRGWRNAEVEGSDIRQIRLLNFGPPDGCAALGCCRGRGGWFFSSGCRLLIPVGRYAANDWRLDDGRGI
jgi:hypothetical protein